MAKRFKELTVDVLIVGSGPLGSTFARQLYEKGCSIFMIDAGAKLSEVPGWHLKNSFLYQRNVNDFTGVVQSHLHKLSVPPNDSVVPTLDPGAFHVDQGKGCIANNANPEQDPHGNLPDASATYCVGGMATHWTACTPREHPSQRSSLIDDKKWDILYKNAEMLLKTNQNMFDDTKINDFGGGAPDGLTHFIRNNLVRDELRSTYPNLQGEKDIPQYLPLAGVRRKDAPEFITWSGADTVLGEKMLEALKTSSSRFQLKEMWQCKQLIYEDTGLGMQQVQYAVVKDLLKQEYYHIHAKTFVIAAGAVLTPQILFNSNIRPQALGHYLCEQPLAFCQVVLLQSIVDSIMKQPAWKKIVEEYQRNHPNDPVPIPMSDPTPQCWIPVSDDRPWHCQVHRDAFSYGRVDPNVDTRLIVDLRWFGKMEPCFDNCVKFSSKVDNKDTFGMPQPTFHVKMSKEDSVIAHEMMGDMLVAAEKLGGFLPGAEPSFQPPGQALHITGTCRMGQSEVDSVVDVHSKVWGYDNLYLGTCGVIPTGSSCNPTLTAMAIAIQACERIPGKSN